MSNWKEYKLNDLVTKLGDGLHGTPKYDPNGDFYFINGSNLIDGKISVNDNTKRVTKEEFDKYKKELSDRTIFVSINGTLGNIATYNNEKVVLGKSACYFNVKEDVSKEFIKYIVTDKTFQHYIYEYATGTTIKNVPLKAIREYTFKIPDLPTQTAIAEILSSLDDKIELNNKINQELENLAQTLFKQWFIDFEFPNQNGEPYKSSGGEMVDSELGDIPKGWEVGTFGDLCKIVNGYAFKSKDFGETGSNGILKIRNVNGSIVDIINTQFVSNNVIASVQDKFKVLSGHILIAMTGAEVGKTGIVPETNKSLWLNQRVGRFEPIIENTIVFIYHLFNVLNFTQAVRGSAMGSAQPNISASGIESINCIIPPKDVIQLFSSVNQDSFNLTLKHLGENQELTNLRDTLLPKLISGELEVKKT